MNYLCLAHMSDEGWEQKYVQEAFDTNWVVPMGPNVNSFEEDLGKFVNGKVVCLSAGTAAVHLHAVKFSSTGRLLKLLHSVKIVQ